jgi:hypothetical protein
MAKPTGLVRAGTALTFHTGVFDERETDGPFLVLKDFEKRAVVAAYRAACAARVAPLDTSPSDYGFREWLVRDGYIGAFEHAEDWYLGNRDFDPDLI